MPRSETAGRIRACLNHIAAVSPGGEMVRVGAHMAWRDKNDPLKRAGLSGGLRALLVEPQPDVFVQLRAAAALEYLDRVTVLNAAVCPTADGNVSFFVGSPTIPKSIALSQAASLSRDHMLKHMEFVRQRARVRSKAGSALRTWYESVNASDLVVETMIPCLTMHSLLRRGGVQAGKVRVITVDAEGFDLDIVRGIPHDALSGLKFLMWESTHLTLDSSQRHRHYVTQLERQFGFDCRGTHGKQRQSLNSKRALDEENVWCIHPGSGPPCNVSAWT